MAITPQAGWEVDPSNPNAVIPIPGGSPTTTTQPTATPAPAPSSTPTVQPTQPAPQPTQQPAQQSPTSSFTPTTPQTYTPGTLTQFLTAQGIPSDTATLTQLAQSQGIQGYQNNPTGNSQLYNDLQQKYQTYLQQQQQSGAQAPTSGGSLQVAQDLAPAASSDPIFNSLTQMMQPILAQLGTVISAVNNPQVTGMSLQDEYNQLAQQNNLPALQGEMLNYQNIMNGTQQDIRDEITSAGGLATDSQVLGMTSARNTVILKQYNAVASQYQAASTNVSNMMQYAATDQQTALQKEQITAGITQNLAQIETQMTSMGLTMQQNAVSAAQYNISQTGYQAFASTLTGNPKMQGYYEQLLNLAPGTLSNPTALASLDTYKEQSLQLTNTLRGVQLYNATGDSSYLTGTGLTSQTTPSTSSTTSTGTTGAQQYGTATSTISNLTGYSPSMPLAQAKPQNLAAAIIQNEGGSFQGVQNNPGNIKYTGLPGQINSGISAADGGTFASYPTPAVGQQAILSDIQAGIKNNPNQTLGQFIDKYTNTAPSSGAGSLLPNPSPLTPGTNANNVGGLVNPSTTGANGGLLQAAGLNNNQGFLIFSMLTGNSSAYTKMSNGQKTALVNATTKWLINNGSKVDISTFLTQYNSNNTTLGGNIQRFNASRIQEGEVIGTAKNLQNTIQQVGLGSFTPANVAALFSGRQFNDPNVSNYSTTLLVLRDEMAGYLAAIRGNLGTNGSPSPDDSDKTSAADAIVNGISNGGLQGFMNAIYQQAPKQNQVMAQSIDNAQQQVWGLFGVGQDYVAKGAKQDMTDSQFVEQTMNMAGTSYQTYVNAIETKFPTDIPVVNNMTGELGHIPPSEFTQSKYTKL